MNEPIDKLIMDLEKKERMQYASAITKLEYDLSIVRNSFQMYFKYLLMFDIADKIYGRNRIRSDCFMYT